VPKKVPRKHYVCLEISVQRKAKHTHPRGIKSSGLAPGHAQKINKLSLLWASHYESKVGQNYARICGSLKKYPKNAMFASRYLYREKQNTQILGGIKSSGLAPGHAQKINKLSLPWVSQP